MVIGKHDGRLRCFPGILPAECAKCYEKGKPFMIRYILPIPFERSDDTCLPLA